jgi:hypothetical protein
MKTKKEKVELVVESEEVDHKLGDLIKSEIRYILYRKRNSLEEDEVTFEESELNEKVVLYFENKETFKRSGGWPEFARKWDVQNKDGEWEIVHRKNSEMREWDAVLTYRTEIFPTLSDGIYKNIVKK